MEPAKVYQGKERRRSVRWYGEIPCEVIFFTDSLPPTFYRSTPGVIRDISASGACIEAKNAEDMKIEPLFWGLMKVGFEWKLSDQGTKLNALTRTIWMKEKGERSAVRTLGLEFLDITTDAQNILREHIANFYISKGKAANKQ